MCQNPEKRKNRNMKETMNEKQKEKKEKQKEEEEEKKKKKKKTRKKPEIRRKIKSMVVDGEGGKVEVAEATKAEAVRRKYRAVELATRQIYGEKVRCSYSALVYGE
ncbi:unnamed protein product [Cuscuta europaea]|uniref:Uncharacterized protein n=1 Tax=Cuscuta europaea TaxID=41803 RepID=A0A9P1DZV8_CUSEU|nr:unnamed protein product [Cuscuta europaea]